MLVKSRIAKDALGIAALLVAAALVGWRCYERMMLPGAPHDAIHTAGSDFRDVIYYPTRAVIAGVNPYDSAEDNPNSYQSQFPVGNNFPLYSPLIFVPALPIAILPLGISVATWWLVNVGLTILLAYVVWRWCGIVPTVAMTATLSAVILLTRPGQANLYFGQATLLFVLASLAALYWARRRPYLAGVALALATMKPTFGGPLAILMFCRRDWRTASLGSILGIAAAIIGLAIVFSHDATGKSPLAVLRGNQEATDRDPAVDPALSNSRIDAVMVAERLLGPAAAPAVRIAIPLLILSVSGLILWRNASQLPATANNNDFENSEKLSSALILVTMAGCVYHNIYDALLLVVPAALAWPASKRRGLMSKRWQGLVVCALLVVPAVSYFSSRQFNELVSKAIPSIGVSVPGRTPLVIQLANGCAVTAAWLLLLAAAARAPNGNAVTTSTTRDALAKNSRPKETLAVARMEFPVSPRTEASEYLISQMEAAPLPVLSADQQGVRP